MNSFQINADLKNIIFSYLTITEEEVRRRKNKTLKRLIYMIERNEDNIFCEIQKNKKFYKMKKHIYMMTGNDKNLFSTIFDKLDLNNDIKENRNFS